MADRLNNKNVSIIVPIYQVEHYIKRCILSLMNQTFHNDIEYIFVNDCTKDKSMEILNSIILDYPNNKVKIINKECNEGLPQARKSGFLESSGKYIIHIDSDDYIEPNCIEDMYKEAEREAADIVCAGYFEEFEYNRKVVLPQHFSTPEEGINQMLRGKFHSGVWNKLVNRKLYKDVIFATQNMHEDLCLSIQLFLNAKKISFINRAYYHYIQYNTHSLTQTINKKKAQSTFTNLKLIVDCLKKKHKEYIFRKSLSNFINTFKGACLMKPENRHFDWLFSLYPESNEYVLTENRLCLYKKVLQWGAIHGITFPYSIFDKLRKIRKK